jgi:hypothetical protein
VGYHSLFPGAWLIEAKGSRRLGMTQLRKGASQLSVPGLMKGPHMRALCGTSIEHRVFMTIDIEAVDDDPSAEDEPEAGRHPSPDENDEELVALANSRMLNYYALQGLPRSALTIRPVGAAVGDEQQQQNQATDLVFPLERDASTLQERAIAQDLATYARRPPSSKSDMLAARVPGTDLFIGMSRRLFAACRSLDEEHAAIQRRLETYSDETAVGSPFESPDEDAYEEHVQARRARFAELEDGSRERIRAVARQAYENGRESEWGQLIDLQPPVITSSSPGMLESATADTYIAIETRIPTADA